MYSKKKLFIFILLLAFLILPVRFTLGEEVPSVVINEVMWAGGDNEWIELYNNTNEDIDLAGWKIDNAKTNQGTLEFQSNNCKNSSCIIPANGYFLICDKEDVGEVKCDFPKASISLTDDYHKIEGEEEKGNGSLVLHSQENNIPIDQTPEAKDKNWPAGKKDTTSKKYYSMERINSKISGSEQCNWETTITKNICDISTTTSGTIYYYGTPKTSNSQISEIDCTQFSANAGNDIISTTNTEITFDASASIGNIEKYIWNFGDGSTQEGKIVTHKYQYPGTYYVSLKVVSEDEDKKDEDLIEVQIFSSQIFISEFLPDPKGDDSGKEWIEITNESNDVQNIAGWGIGNKAEKAVFIFPEGTYLASNSLILFSSALTKISLSNDSGSVFLFYPSGNISQEIKYEKPGEGVAVARKDGKYVYTENPTPGMKNIVSLASQGAQSNNTSQSQNAVSEIGQSQNLTQPQGLVATQEPVSSDSKVINNGDTEIALEKQEITAPTPVLPNNILNKSLLAEITSNQSKLILAILGVICCSGFFGVGLVILRGKLKNKNINHKGTEKIEVEIEE